MAQPQAGWYPDPSGDNGKLRYWDGVQWTDSYMDNPQSAAVDAVEAAAAAQERTDPMWAQPQQPQVDATQQPQPQPQAQQVYGQQPTYVQPTYIQQPQQACAPMVYSMTKEDQTLRLIAFIFNLVCTISVGWALIPLAWMIPMCVRSWGIYKGTKPNTTVFGVLDLIFCSLVSGILLLVSTKDE